MNQRLCLRLLGGFEARGADGALLPAIGTKKARALLAYVALKAGRAVPRETAAALLWSRVPDRQAMASLSQALYTLRRALEGVGPPIIRANAETLCCDPAMIWIDVPAFEAGAGAADPDDLAKALALYRGPLLAGLDLREPEFEDWLRFERTRLDDLAVVAAGKHLELLAPAGDARARDAAVSMLRHDPYAEAAHRALMLYQARAGSPGRARAQFMRCRDVLARDLQIAPEPQTCALMQRIERGEIGPAQATTSPQAWGRRRDHGPLAAAIMGLGAVLWLLQSSVPGHDGGGGDGARVPVEALGAASLPDDPAMDAYLAGRAALARATPEATATAAREFTAALARDPDLADARAGLARAYHKAAFGDQAHADALDLHAGEAYARLQAVLQETGSSSAEALVLAADLALRRRDYAGAIAAAREARALAPEDAGPMQALAEALIYAGEADAGAALAREALRRAPDRAARSYYLLGLAAYASGDAAAAIAALERARALLPSPDGQVSGLLAAALGPMDPQAAAVHLAEHAAALRDRPRREDRLSSALTFENPRRHSWQRPNIASAVYGFPFAEAAVVESLAAGFEAAGLVGGSMGYLTFAAEARVGGAGPVSVEHISASGTPLGFRLPYPGAAELVVAAKQGYFVEGADESQLCARWHLPHSDVSACGSLFRRSPDGGSAGAYVLATALGPIDVAASRVGARAHH